MPAAQRAYAATAAADAHHGPYWVNHPFHVLPPSPWPLLGGWGAGVACLGMSAFFHSMPGGTALMLTGIGSVAMTAMAWWRDCIIESDQGMHTEVVKRNLMSGIWIFIVSEAALFFGLLWSCVHLGEFWVKAAVAGLAGGWLGSGWGRMIVKTSICNGLRRSILISFCPMHW